MSYTNKWGQTVAPTATSTGMIPAFDSTGATNGITVPNTAGDPTKPVITAAPAALKDQDEAGIHPLSPQYNGTSPVLAAEIAAIED